MTRPDGVDEQDWARAVEVASRDRHRLARLVRDGRVTRVKGKEALPLPPVPPRVNLAIRNKRKAARKRR